MLRGKRILAIEEPNPQPMKKQKKPQDMQQQGTEQQDTEQERTKKKNKRRLNQKDLIELGLKPTESNSGHSVSVQCRFCQRFGRETAVHSQKSWRELDGYFRVSSIKRHMRNQHKRKWTLFCKKKLKGKREFFAQHENLDGWLVKAKHFAFCLSDEITELVQVLLSKFL